MVFFENFLFKNTYKNSHYKDRIIKLYMKGKIIDFKVIEKLEQSKHFSVRY